METNYIFLTTGQLLTASVLMAVNIGLSLILKLGLAKQWSIASLRMVGQLLLVGFLLDWVFALNNPFWILGVALFMATIASITAVGRTRKRFSAIYLNSFISILGAGFFVMFFALSGVLQIDPWYSPQYLFPLLGMVLGNTLNGISLALERFMDSLSVRRKEVEMLLSLGATSWEAAHDLIRDALRTSMIPTLNSMMVMGIVSLPGMMTGQILAYDKHHDLAAIKLNNTRKLDYVSTVIPKDEIDDLRIADPVWVSGCSLLHDPFPNAGTLTSLREMIDQKAYIMQNAPSIFGNSGGGLFHGVTGHLLGLTSRITVTQLGFGMDVQSWMGFSTHPDRLYEFFDHQELQFLYDSNDNYYDAMKRRDNRRKETLRSVLVDGEDSKPAPVAPPEDFVI